MSLKRIKYIGDHPGRPGRQQSEQKGIEQFSLSKLILKHIKALNPILDQDEQGILDSEMIFGLRQPSE